MRIPLVLFTLLVAACGVPPPDAPAQDAGPESPTPVVGVRLDVANYDQSCTRHEDCVPKDPACLLQQCCATDAINAADEEQFDLDRGALVCESSGVVCDCDDVQASCINGTCVLENCAEVTCRPE